MNSRPARRLSLNFVVLAGGELLAKVATFAAFVFLARSLGPDRYGGVEFVIAAMVLFTLPVDLGLGVYGAREVARGGNAPRLLEEISALRLILASLSLALLLACASFLPLDREVRSLLFAYGATLLVEPVLVQWFFQAHERMSVVAAALFIRKWVFAICVFLFVRSDSPLLWIGLCECAAAVSVGLFCVAALRVQLKIVFPRPRVGYRALRSHLRQSAPIGLSEVAWAVLWYSAILVMGLMTASEQLGFFSAAHRIVIALHTFVWLYFYNLLPTFSRKAIGSRKSLTVLVSRSLAWTAWGGCFVALVGSVLAPSVLQLVYGKAFAGVIIPLGILIWVIPVTLASGHYRYLLIAFNRQDLEFGCTAISAATGLGLAAVLVGSFGAVGAAVSLLVANVVNLLIAAAAVRRVVAPIPYFFAVLWPGVAAAALAVFTAMRDSDSITALLSAVGIYLVLLAIWAVVSARPLSAATSETPTECAAESSASSGL